MSSCWFAKQLLDCFIHYFLEFSYEFQSVSSLAGFWQVFLIFWLFLITFMIWRWLFCCLLLVYFSSMFTWLSCHFMSLCWQASWDFLPCVWWNFFHPPFFHYSFCNVPDALGIWCLPVSFLLVLASLPNAVVSSSISSCSWLSAMFLHVAACLVIFLYMMPLTGFSPMLSLYFIICPRSPIDLALAHFLSLLQCLPLGCPFSIQGIQS